jgi:MFS family permease
MNELQRSKLPFFQMVTVFAIQFSEAMNINVLFPFLAFFVEDLGYGGHVLGYYAGGLAASFCAAQFLSAVVWGAISDRLN